MSAHPIGAATDTAAFVRAQLRNGVSIETLRKKLGIRPEHMLDLLSGASEPPLPKIELARRPKQLPTGGWGARGARQATTAGLSKAAIIRRAMEDRAEAARLLSRVLPVVAAITRFDPKRILGADKAAPAQLYRSMVIALMRELVPTCPLIAIGHALNRQANVVERSLERCERARAINREFGQQYLTALSRLAS